MKQEFNQIVFCHAGNVEETVMPGGVHLLRRPAAGSYLALDEQQNGIFALFDGIRTVQEALCHLFCTAGNPDIRQFYDLVLHAQEKGFLVETGRSETVPAGPVLNTVRWKAGWRVWPVVAMALVLIPAGYFVYRTEGETMPTSITGLLIALVTLSATLSLAYFMAGFVLSGYRRYAYMPGLRLRYLVPFWAVDLRDTFMGGRACQAACALQMLTIPFAIAVIGFFLRSPDLIFGSCIAAFVLSCPFGELPGHELLHAIFRRAYQFPKCGRTFLHKRLFAYLFRYHVRNHEEKYLMTYSVYAICWLAFLISYGGGLLRIHGHLFLDYINTPEQVSRQLLGIIVLGAIAAMLVIPAVYQFALMVQNLGELVSPLLAPVRESRRRTHETCVGEPDTLDLQQFLKAHLLFSLIPDETLSVAAHVIGYATVPANTTIVKEGDPGSSLFIIHSGKVAISKLNEAGEQRVVAVLGRGDAFGEISLLEGRPRTASAIAVENSGLLILRKRDFDRLLLKTVGAETIRTAIQVTAFLQKQPICKGWPEAVLADFSKHFALEDYEAGTTIIQARQPNHDFFIVYEGEAHVQRDGKADKTLVTGDFFGEISLMKSVPATADVVAGLHCRCLRIEQDEFFHFVTRDIVTVVLVASIMDDRIRRNL